MSTSSQNWGQSAVTKRPGSVSANQFSQLNSFEQPKNSNNSNLANYLIKKYQEQKPIEALSNDRFFKLNNW